MLRGILYLLAILILITTINAQNLLMFKSNDQQIKEVENIIYDLSHKKAEKIKTELIDEVDTLDKVIYRWQLEKKILKLRWKQINRLKEKLSNESDSNKGIPDFDLLIIDLDYTNTLADSIEIYETKITEIVKEKFVREKRIEFLQKIVTEEQYPTQITLDTLQYQIAMYDTVDFKAAVATRKKLWQLLTADNKYSELKEKSTARFTHNGTTEKVTYPKFTKVEFDEMTITIIDSLLNYSQKEYQSFLKAQITVAAAINKGRDADLSIKPNIKTAVLFRPANTSLLLYPYISANVLSNQFDGRYDSGANLIIREASTFTFGLNADLRTGNHTGLYFKAAYSLKRLADSTKIIDLEDSTKFYPVNNVGTLNANLGFELMPVPQKLSLYVGIQFLQVVSKDESYTQFFGEDVKQHFLMPEFGIRVRFSEKIFASLKVILISDEYKKLLGNGDDIIPVLKLSAENLL